MENNYMTSSPRSAVRLKIVCKNVVLKTIRWKTGLTFSWRMPLISDESMWIRICAAGGGRLFGGDTTALAANRSQKACFSTWSSAFRPSAHWWSLE